MSTVIGYPTIEAARAAQGVSTAAAGLEAAKSGLFGFDPTSLALSMALQVLAKKFSPTYSSNAGLLIHDVPGAKDDLTFEVDPFASGFKPVGFGRRASQEEASKVVDAFRGIDQALYDMAAAAGIAPDYSNRKDPFSGYSETGRGDGVFLGMAAEAGKYKSQDLESQLANFVKQWVSGIDAPMDQSALDRLFSASTLEQVMNAAGYLFQRKAAENNDAPEGYVKDSGGFYRSTNPNDDGYYLPDGKGGVVATTPPMVPIPKPTTGAAGGGGGGGGGGSSADSGGNPNDPAPGPGREHSWEYLGRGQWRHVDSGYTRHDPDYDENPAAYDESRKVGDRGSRATWDETAVAGTPQEEDTVDRILGWLGKNPNATDWDIRVIMDQAGVTPEEVSRATGKTIEEVTQRYEDARPTTTPTTPGSGSGNGTGTGSGSGGGPGVGVDSSWWDGPGTSGGTGGGVGSGSGSGNGPGSGSGSGGGNGPGQGGDGDGLMSLLGGTNRRVDVKSPEGARIGPAYDFQSIFANPAQEAFYRSPYESYEVGPDGLPIAELYRLLGGVV